jgi:hypothetical protein
MMKKETMTTDTTIKTMTTTTKNRKGPIRGLICYVIYMSMKRMILIISLLFCLSSLSQKVVKKKPIVRDSIVEITYTDGTHRKMVWVNDSTVMLVMGDVKGRNFSKAYIDPEFATREKRIYFIIKFED